MRKRTAARLTLIAVSLVWVLTIWAFSVGAVEPSDPEGEVGARTHTVCSQGPNPLDEPECTSPAHTTSGTTTTSRTTTTGGTTGGTASGTTSRATTTASSTTTGGASPTGTASPSPTGGESFRSRISIDYGRGRFFGRVRSEHNRCIARRSVVLKRARFGRDEIVVQTRTDVEGDWRVRLLRPRHKRYYAKVRPKTIGAGRCEGARSRTIRP